MSQYQYNVDESDLVNLSSPALDLAEKVMKQQYQELEDRLTELLPEHLRDGHDLAAAQAWFQEHGFTISSDTNAFDLTRTITINYPSYLD
jgi:hypothetical protein